MFTFSAIIFAQNFEHVILSRFNPLFQVVLLPLKYRNTLRTFRYSVDPFHIFLGGLLDATVLLLEMKPGDFVSLRVSFLNFFLFTVSY